MCGIVGAFGSPDATRLVHTALGQLLRRTESGRVLYSNGETIVGHVLSERKASASLKGPHLAAIGRTTTRPVSITGSMPNAKFSRQGPFTVLYDGKITNIRRIRQKLLMNGAVLHTETTTEVVLHLICSYDGDLPAAVAKAVIELRGTYALLVLTPRSLLVAHHSRNGRPLRIGQLDSSWLVAPNTRLFQLFPAIQVVPIGPNDIVEINAGGVKPIPHA